MKLKDMIMLLLLAALWGGSFLFIRIGAPALGPLILVELRVVLAGITLIIFAIVSRHRIHVLGKWWQYLILGTANAAIPFTLIALAELHLDAGFAAILNATTPMFTAVIAWLWIGDPFTKRKLLGVILGIVGVAVLVDFGFSGHGVSLWVPASCSILAAVIYGFAGVFSSRYFKGEKPLDMAIGQQLAASLILLPFAMFAIPHEMPSRVVIFSVLGLAILCTALAYLIFFTLIHRIGALRTLTVTFLVPVFGIIWGKLFLGEQITIHLLLGLMIILCSVALMANINFKKPKKNEINPK